MARVDEVAWLVIAAYIGLGIGVVNLAYALFAGVFAAWMAMTAWTATSVFATILVFRDIGNRARDGWYREADGEAYDLRGLRVGETLHVGWWTKHTNDDQEDD